MNADKIKRIMELIAQYGCWCVDASMTQIKARSQTYLHEAERVFAEIKRLLEEEQAK